MTGYLRVTIPIRTADAAPEPVIIPVHQRTRVVVPMRFFHSAAPNLKEINGALVFFSPCLN